MESTCSPVNTMIMKKPGSIPSIIAYVLNFEEHINHEQVSRLEHVAGSALGSRLLPMNLETHVSPTLSEVLLIAI